MPALDSTERPLELKAPPEVMEWIEFFRSIGCVDDYENVVLIAVVDGVQRMMRARTDLGVPVLADMEWNGMRIVLRSSIKWSGSEKLETIEVLQTYTPECLQQQGRFRRMLDVIEAMAAISGKSVYVEAIGNEHLWKFLKRSGYRQVCLSLKSLLRTPQPEEHPTLTGTDSLLRSDVALDLGVWSGPCMDIRLEAPLLAVEDISPVTFE